MTPEEELAEVKVVLNKLEDVRKDLRRMYAYSGGHVVFALKAVVRAEESLRKEICDIEYWKLHMRK